MGCDIHCYSETRIGNKWVADEAHTFSEEPCTWSEDEDNTELDMDEFDVGGRNYWLFALFAGVRGEMPWSFEPKGFPADSSKEVARLFESWDCDAHTPSWLTQQELADKYAELVKRHPILKIELLLLDDSSAMADAMQDNIEELEKILNKLRHPDHAAEHRRLVFWFDN